MFYPHRIRLHGPWEYQPLAFTQLLADGSTTVLTGDLPPAGKIILPADWGETLGNDFRGRVRYRRRFHKPTGLSVNETVWLVCEGVDAFGSVALNGTALGELPGYAHPMEEEITDLLRDTNELVLDVELPQLAPGVAPLRRPGRDRLPGGPIGYVRLEIRLGRDS